MDDALDTDDQEIFESAAYKEYHKKVVDAAVASASEAMKKFFDSCSYVESFLKGEDPVEVGQTEWEDLNR